MLKGLYILDEQSYAKIYGDDAKQIIESMVHIYAPPQTKTSILDNMHLLNEADIILSGWGGPKMDRPFMEAAPRLKAVFYGAGSIKALVTDDFWNRKIPITSAFSINAMPVADFTVGQILFSIKNGWQFANRTGTEQKAMLRKDLSQGRAGTNGGVVGIVSLGMIGRKVCELLRAFDLRVIAYDPFVSEEAARKLNVELVSLDELFALSDVVSLHTPWLKETEGMITGKHIASMKRWATLINTSRGAVINEPEMIEVLQSRPDLYALLDVTYPEPPAADSPLRTLPNVILTPHIAGALAFGETSRMGLFMAEELKRFCNGEPLKGAVTKEQASIMA